MPKSKKEHLDVPGLSGRVQVLVITRVTAIAREFRRLPQSEHWSFALHDKVDTVPQADWDACGVLLVDPSAVEQAIERGLSERAVLAAVVRRTADAAKATHPLVRDVFRIPKDLLLLGMRLRNLVDIGTLSSTPVVPAVVVTRDKAPAPAAVGRLPTAGHNMAHARTNSLVHSADSNKRATLMFDSVTGIHRFETPLQRALRTLRATVAQAHDATSSDLLDALHLLEDLALDAGPSTSLQLHAQSASSGAQLDAQTREWLESQLRISSPVAPSPSSGRAAVEAEREVPLLDQAAREHRAHLLSLLCEPAFDPHLRVADELMDMCVAMFYHYNLLARYRIDERVLRAFLASVASAYNATSYHSWMHAVDVAQFLFVQLEVGGAAGFLNYQDIFALFIAALGHDVDHPGRTNQYQISQRTELAYLYNDISVLENHHAATLFRILRIPENNILANLKPSELANVRSKVISSILATDMSHHFAMVDTLAARAERINELSFQTDTKEDRTRQQQSKEDRRLLIKMLIHAADISNPVRPFDIAKMWASRLEQEFFSQGDAERAAGCPVSAFMDRNSPNLPQLQLNFVDFIVRPLYENVARILPAMSPTLATLAVNRSEWAARLQPPTTTS